jgi:hypothetical protein
MSFGDMFLFAVTDKYSNDVSVFKTTSSFIDLQHAERFVRLQTP